MLLTLSASVLFHRIEQQSCRRFPRLWFLPAYVSGCLSSTALQLRQQFCSAFSHLALYRSRWKVCRSTGSTFVYLPVFSFFSFCRYRSGKFLFSLYVRGLSCAMPSILLSRKLNPPLLPVWLTILLITAPACFLLPLLPHFVPVV